MSWTLSAFADEIDGDLSVQIKNLHEHGINLIDLRTLNGKNVMQLSDEEITEFIGTIHREGLSVNCVASPINKVKSSEVIAEEEFAKLVRAGEIAKRCGINRIRIFTPEADDWGTIEAWMTPMVEHAVKEGLLLMHENDGKYYGAYPEQAKRLFAEFGGYHFRAAFDFANSVQIGFKAMDDWFPWILPHLETIHMKDARSDGKVVPVGEGVGQVPETIEFLRKEGWMGVFSIEPHLQYAGERHGFSGPESFGIATSAVKGVLGL